MSNLFKILLDAGEPELKFMEDSVTSFAVLREAVFSRFPPLESKFKFGNVKFFFIGECWFAEYCSEKHFQIVQLMAPFIKNT